MSRTHSTLGVSPTNEMLFGFRPDLPLAVRGPVLMALVDARPDLFPADHMQLTRDRREELYARVQVQLRQQHIKNAAQHARRHPSTSHHQIAEGDLVWDLGHFKGALYTSVRGPFLVVSISPAGTHASLSTGSTQHREAKTFRRNLSQLVKCHERPARG